MNQYDEQSLLDAIEALVVDNPELEKLEDLLDQFNIFEALNAVKVEVRHSDFLAFLLNPKQNHGLREIFATRLIQKAIGVEKRFDSPVTAIELDIWDLQELDVRREWHNIDILLIDDANRLAVIIENKIESEEHSHQLQRYYATVEQHYPGYRVVAVYLTPDGEIPSDERYIPISYTLICELVENLIETKRSTIGPDAATLMAHYAEMLRRNVVSESEIAELCRKIYRKHQRALDLIYEYIPDQIAIRKDILEELIKATPGLELEYSTKTRIRFLPVEWKKLEILNQGEGWTPSGRMLMFQFMNMQDKVYLRLVIGPGPVDTREKLLEMSEKNPPLKAYRTLGEKFNTVYQFAILTKRDVEDDEIENIAMKIKKRWNEFLSEGLPKIKEIISKQEWYG